MTVKPGPGHRPFVMPLSEEAHRRHRRVPYADPRVRERHALLLVRVADAVGERDLLGHLLYRGEGAEAVRAGRCCRERDIGELEIVLALDKVFEIHQGAVLHESREAPGHGHEAGIRLQSKCGKY